MRIINVNIPGEELIDIGISPIKMRNLDSIVLLAGPNGSGKTRLLKKIQESLVFSLSENQKTKIENDLKNMQKALSNPANASNFAAYNENIRNFKSQLEKNKYFEFSEKVTSKVNGISFIPKSLQLSDSNAITPSQMLDKSIAIDNLGLENIQDTTFSKIQVIQNRYFEATHPQSQLSPDEKNKCINDYNKLNELISKFLNTKVERDKDGHATLFGFKLGKSQLSDGQKILIQFCMAVYSQKEKLNDLIIFLDEPENHLHPMAIKKMINSLMEIVPSQNIQIWIATHSIPLLSQFSLSNLWYMNNGQIQFAGRTPEVIIDGLIGSDEDYLKLQSFLMPTNDFALINFSLECLFQPAVASCIHDDQSQQIIKAIIENSKNLQRPIRILDFGAGKGRILEALYETFKDTDSNFSELINYIAYDLSTRNTEQCKNIIKASYKDTSPENRYFNDINALKKIITNDFFDVIIMCNVLHEIHPESWLNIFTGKNGLQSLLTQSGNLLIVEDMQLPTGELAHDDGFIILNREAIKILFQIIDDEELKIYDERNNGRLLAYQIKKNAINKISNETIINALQDIQKSASKKIMELRKILSGSYKNGISHAFWTQQLVNSLFALNKFMAKKN